jgi:hypothetical protein
MVACIDFFEMSEICRPKFIVRHSTIAATEFWPSLSCQFKKNGCSPCFIMTFGIDVQKFVNVILHSNSCEHATNTLFQ